MTEAIDNVKPVNDNNNEQAIEKTNNEVDNTINNDINNAEQNYQYNYINRLRRQPKGYRKMMSMNGY